MQNYVNTAVQKTSMVAHKAYILCMLIMNVHTHAQCMQKRYFKGELTAHCMKRTDVSEEDIIKDILWLKGWLGGCCRCTYSKW